MAFTAKLFSLLLITTFFSQISFAGAIGADCRVQTYHLSKPIKMFRTKDLLQDGATDQIKLDLLTEDNQPREFRLTVTKVKARPDFSSSRNNWVGVILEILNPFGSSRLYNNDLTDEFEAGTNFLQETLIPLPKHPKVSSDGVLHKNVSILTPYFLVFALDVANPPWVEKQNPRRFEPKRGTEIRTSDGLVFDSLQIVCNKIEEFN